MNTAPMKPETIERRRLKRQRETAESKARLRRRLGEMLDRDGIGSIWAELLALHEETDPRFS